MNNEDLMRMLEKIDGRLDQYGETLARLTLSVEYHVKRTDLLEADVKTVKKHVELVNAAAKILSIALTLALAGKSLGLF